MITRKPVLGLLAATAICSVAFTPVASAQTLQELKTQIDTLSSKVTELEAKEAATAKRIPNVKVKWKGAPEFSSADGKFKMKIRGRIFTDYANVTAKNNGVKLAGQKIDKTEFRTARLGVEGIVFSDVKYKFEADLTGGGTEIKDAYLQVHMKPLKFTFGQFKTSNSLEEQTSSRYITFMERAAFTDAFGLARQIGASIGYVKDGVTLTAGIFQGDFENKDHQQDRTYAGRVTFGPKVSNGDVQLHFGASIRYRELDVNGARYRQRPFAHLAANRYISADLRGTSIGDARSDVMYAGEAAAVMGPVSLQGEYAVLEAKRIGTSQKAKFSGGYVSASYFITGETRKYKHGAFSRVKVIKPISEGGSGAWEIAARFDTLELNDNSAGILGGKQDTYIVGVNWHLNNYTRIMTDFSHSNVKDGDHSVTDVNTFGARFQVDW